jgi:hypothetical protein
MPFYTFETLATVCIYADTEEQARAIFRNATLALDEDNPSVSMGSDLKLVDIDKDDNQE